MKRLILILVFCITVVVNTNAQAPEIYNRVDHILWIVEDLRTVKKNWQQLGFDQVKEEGDVTLLSKFSGEGESVKARIAVGTMDALRVIWIQAPKRGNPFSEFMRNSREGVYSLVYTVENKKSLKEEAQRLKDLNITILDNLEIRTSHGKFSYYLFNTAREGKYTLGFLLEEEARRLFDPVMDGTNQYHLKFSQYAFAVADESDVSDFWYDFGLPEFTVTHDSLSDKIYYGKPGVFDVKLGWQRHGSIPFEWCIPLKGPNVYDDHIKLHGDGIHHLAFETADIDTVLADYTAKGFVISQSGGWGEKGKPGSGRFAYLDPKGLGGITIELLWNYKE